MKLVAQGSNKDIYEIPGAKDHLAFCFSGRISVFDVGALPEEIPGRAQSLDRFALAVATRLAKCGVPQAFDAKLSVEHKVFVQRRVRHPRVDAPKARASSEELIFVPLEVIVRWGVPAGSSLVKKDPNQYRVGMRFKEPRIDYTTKLEAQDRPLEAPEAASLCPEGLSLQSLEVFVLEAAAELHRYFAELDLELWDAKFELGFDPRSGSLLLVDAVTPDEVRLTHKAHPGVPLSKELLRFWLRQTPWFDEVSRLKSSGSTDWKHGLPNPPRLGAWRLGTLSEIYAGLADLVANHDSKRLLSVLSQESTRPKVCVLGEGGREAALRWRFQREGCDLVSDVESADSVFVGMDADLASGVADVFRAKSVWACGPSQAASRLEWSKQFGREIAQSSAVTAPLYAKQISDFPRTSVPPVLKMDGLAGGKGVFLFESWAELEVQIAELEKQSIAYHLEERCEGYEASVFFVIERDAWGRVQARYLGSAQDFKRRFEGDKGPNTGGMGALAPHPLLSYSDIQTFQRWAQSTAETMETRGTPYRGVLYIGAMKDKSKDWVLIEYNARFGDPETQALVVLWPESVPVLRGLVQLSLDTLPQAAATEHSDKTLCLALVNPGYPGPCDPLEAFDWGVTNSADLKLFCTKSRSGRMAYLVARSANFSGSAEKVSALLEKATWKSLVAWRSDILERGLES